MVKNIYLVRHGQTTLNASHLIQGQGINAGLDTLGKAQANAFWRQYSDHDFSLIVYTSLLRSKQSVRQFLIAGRAGIEVADLREISWGDMEGKPNTDDVKAEYLATNAAWEGGDFDASTTGGESISSVEQRCKRFLDWFLKLDMENALICAHGRTIRVLGCLLTGTPLTAMRTFSHSNMGLYVFTHQAEKYSVTLSNDQTHLHGLS